MDALSIADAARLVGVAERTLRRRIERGTLAAVTVDGRRMIARSELVRAYGPVAGSAPDVSGSEPDTTTPTPPAHAETAAELATLRAEVARLRGMLEMSERVETAAQRAADKLEAKLDEARRESLSLARRIGQVEGERDTIRAQLSAPSRPWWRFGR